MPRITEGIEEITRTHQISSPTSPAIVHDGGFNACNQCHLEKPIQWTVGYLKDWYGKDYEPEKLAKTYGDLNEPFGSYWLTAQSREVFKMPALGAMRRTKAKWLAPAAVKQLDSPRLIVRQFAQDAIEDAMDVKLDSWGYQYWLTASERRRVLPQVERAILGTVEPENAK